MRSKLACLVLAAVLSRASAGEPAAEEYRVKGAFLLNFAKFVEWPAPVFKAPGDPLAICVLGSNPFTAALEQAARAVVVDNRALTMRPIPDLQQAHACQILFVGQSEKRRMHAVLEAVQGDSILTVGETDGFLAAGGVIEFRVEDGKVKIDISAAAAKRAGLHISAKLMSVAQSGKR